MVAASRLWTCCSPTLPPYALGAKFYAYKEFLSIKAKIFELGPNRASARNATKTAMVG